MKPLVLRRALETRVVRSGLRVLEHLDSRSTSILRVLTYHLIEDAAGFRDQMQHLAAHYQPVDEEMVAGALLEGAELPPRAVLVTFDDADRNFGEVAWPILREARVPALLFVPTAYPDHPERRFWWDELIHTVGETRLATLSVDGMELPVETPDEQREAIRALKRRVQRLEPAEIQPWIDDLRGRAGVGASAGRVLSWAALRQLVAEGVTIGAHTRSHPFLDRLSPEELRDEIAGSVGDLEEKLGSSPRSFAYPNGRYSPAVVEAVERAGFSFAFTTDRGANHMKNVPRFLLRRINVGPRVGRGALQARLLQSSPRLLRPTSAPHAP